MKLLLFIFLAASFAATSNFFFRKNTSNNGNMNTYMCSQYFFSLLVSLLFFDSYTQSSWNPTMALIGVVCGILNVSMMYLVSTALKKGPSGPVFAFQNAGSVFPGLILFFIFGPDFGYKVTFFQIFGLLLVLAGLCCFAMKSPTTPQKNKTYENWVWCALGCFMIQVIGAVVTQWRCLLFCENNDHWLIFTQVRETDDVWFLPGCFISAFICQSFLAWLDRKPIQMKDLTYGISGGVTNGISSFIMVTATKIALPAEQTILFPSFAVMVIFLCSFWAKAIYKEKFDYLSHALCGVGIIVSSI